MTRFSKCSAGAVVEHDLFQGDDQPAGVARLADLPQALQPCQHVAFGHAVADEDADLLVGGGRRCPRRAVLSSS